MEEYKCILKEKYKNEIAQKMMDEFKYKNVMQVPRLEKIVLNMGLGEGIQNNKLIQAGVKQLAAISGQKPVICRARKNISSFKLRKGMPIGVKVTLRGERMYDFLYRLINIGLPRVRDFRGTPKTGFDGRGNYTLGIKEQIIFPEVDYDTVEKIKGLNVTIVTTAKTDEEAMALLKHFGMPFRK